MSSAFDAALEPITIAAAASASRVVVALHEYADAASIALQAVGTLEAGTYTIEVSTTHRKNATDYVNGDFATLNDGTADIGPPGTGKARSYTEMIPFHAFRIAKSGAVASAPIIFNASKNFTVNF